MFLKDLFEFLPKSNRPASFGSKDGIYPFFTSSNTVDKYVNDFDYEGEYLIIGDGGTANCKYYKGKFSASDHNYILKPKDKVKCKLVRYFLMKDNYKILSDGFKGVGIKNVSKTYIQNINFIRNTRYTDEEIIESLSKIENLIEIKNKELNQLDELIKSRFIELFGNEDNYLWETKKLENIGVCKNGMNFSYKKGGFKINCLGVGDFKENDIIKDTYSLPIIELTKKPDDEYLLKNDDIVFVRSNGNRLLVGRSVLVYPNSNPTVFSGFCIRFRKNTDLVNSDFLLHFFKTDDIRIKMRGRGANIQNLNQKILNSLLIPIPPKSLQDEFSEFIKLIDKSKFSVQKEIELYQELLDKKMEEYFG